MFSDQKINENSDHVELLCLLKQNNDDRKRSLTYNNQIHLLSSNKIKEINFPARTNKRTASIDYPWNHFHHKSKMYSHLDY